MKITKSELKEMILEVLREELSRAKRKPIKEKVATGWQEYEITYSFGSDPTEIYTDIIAAKIREDEDKIIDRFFDSLYNSGYDDDADGGVEIIEIKSI